MSTGTNPASSREFYKYAKQVLKMNCIVLVFPSFDQKQEDLTQPIRVVVKNEATARLLPRKFSGRDIVVYVSKSMELLDFSVMETFRR